MHYFWVLAVFLLIGHAPDSLAQSASPAASMGVSVYQEGKPAQGLTAAQLASSPDSSFSPFYATKAYQTSGSQALWLRLRINAQQDMPANNWVLDIGKPFIDRVIVHSVQPDGTWRSQSAGDRIAHSQWAKKSLAPQFYLPQLAAGQHDVYAEIYTEIPMYLSVTLTSAEAAHTKAQNTFLICGIVFGLMLLMAIVSGILAAAYRSPAYAWYAGYAVAILLVCASYMGAGSYALWPQSQWWPEHSIGFLAITALLLQLAFCRSMFQLPNTPAWLRYAVITELVIGSLSTVGYLFLTDVSLRVGLLTVHPLICSVLMMLLVAYAMRSGNVSSYLWALAYVPLLVVMVLEFIEHLGYWALPWLPYNALLYVLLLEMPLLLLALHWHAKTQHAQSVRQSTLDSTDPMTGFVSSALFPAKLAQVWNTTRKAHHELAVAYIAVSTVSWNTAAPDQMRARVVRVLRTVVHDRDNVAHVDKDIYAIILPNIALGDNLSAVLSRLIALGAMQDKTVLDHAPIAFRIVASTQSSFAGTAQELHEAMRKKLLDSKGWSRRAIRFVSDIPHAKSSQSSDESFSAFWQRAQDSSKEDSTKD